MAKTKETFAFKRGDRFHLDQIMHIQGLARGDWWEKTCDDTAPGESDMGEDLICTRDIKITIIVETTGADQ